MSKEEEIVNTVGSEKEVAICYAKKTDHDLEAATVAYQESVAAWSDAHFAATDLPGHDRPEGEDEEVDAAWDACSQREMEMLRAERELEWAREENGEAWGRVTEIEEHRGQEEEER